MSKENKNRSREFTLQPTINEILTNDIVMKYLDILNMHIGTLTGTSCFIKLLTFAIVPKLYLLMTFNKSHKLES
jgi:antibiotic biosynthesis monooxygenase (ABM) superfamily enzyme